MTATSVPALSVLAEHFSGLLDLAGRVTTRTLVEYRRDTHLYLVFCIIESREPNEPQSLRAWQADMADHTTLSPNTINRRLVAIKRVIRSTALLGDLSMDVAHGFSLVEPVQVSTLRSRLRSDVRVPLQPWQVKKLVDTPNNKTFAGRRDRAILATFAGSGCRIGEIVRLQRDDILASHGAWLIRGWRLSTGSPAKPLRSGSLLDLLTSMSKPCLQDLVQALMVSQLHEPSLAMRRGGSCANTRRRRTCRA